MIYLENINKEKEEQLRLEQKDLNRSIRKIEREKNREIKKIQKELDKIEVEVQQQIEFENKKYKEQAERITEEYSRGASGEIIKDLERFYKIIQERSQLIGLKPEDIEILTHISSNIKNIKDHKERKRTEDLVMLASSEKKYKEALPLFLHGNMEEEIIYSYIGKAEKGQICYLLSPINGEDNKSLAKNLENKILSILDIGKITSSLQGFVTSRGEVVSTKSVEIGFSQDLELSKSGFVLYTLIPQDPKDSSLLVTCIEKKLEELQPESFKEWRLMHKVQEVDFCILDYFKNHPKTEMYTTKDKIEELRLGDINSLNIEESAELMHLSVRRIKLLITKGKLTKTEVGEISLDSIESYMQPKQKQILKEKVQKPYISNKLNFTAETIEEKKQEVYRRLEEYGPELTPTQLAKVLGYTSQREIIVSARGFKIAKKLNTRKEKKGKHYCIYVPKQEILNFVRNHTPTDYRWMK